VKVQVGSDTRIENSYNALNWRVSSRADTDVPGDGSLDEERIMYYNAGWQLVEEDIYEDWSSGNPGSVDERRAHIRGFWGARYIDDLVQTLVDGNADGDYVDTSGGGDEHFFFLSDAQFSVTAVLDGNANLQERMVYDAYGEANHHDWRDTDGDGDPSGGDATDRSTINTLASASPSGTPITNASYEPDADLDRDGDVDSTDLSLGGTTYPTPLNKGELSLPAVGNRFGYDGYRFNPETEQYTVRNRHYDTVLGRWLERDPAGYVDGPDLYLYVGGTPADSVDPTGMTDGLDFVMIFYRRIFRKYGFGPFLLGSDWLWGETYDLDDDEGDLITANRVQANDFIRAYIKEQRQQGVLFDGTKRVYSIGPIPDVRKKAGQTGGYTGQWRFWSDGSLLGDGDFWINGSEGVEVVGGEFEACVKDGQIKVWSVDVDYIWHDSIDANSFAEQVRRGSFSNAGFSRIVLNVIEGVWDLSVDKIQDLDYKVRIGFSDERSGERTPLISVPVDE